MSIFVPCTTRVCTWAHPGHRICSAYTSSPVLSISSFLAMPQRSRGRRGLISGREIFTFYTNGRSGSVGRMRDGQDNARTSFSVACLVIRGVCAARPLSSSSQRVIPFGGLCMMGDWGWNGRGVGEAVIKICLWNWKASQISTSSWTKLSRAVAGPSSHRENVSDCIFSLLRMWVDIRESQTGMDIN